MRYIINNAKFVKKIFNIDSYSDTVLSEREGHWGRRELNEQST